MIAILGFFTYRNFVNLKNIEEIPPLLQEMPNVNIPSLEEMLPTDIDDLMRKHDIMGEPTEPEKIEYVSHSIPGVALFEYPSHWKELDLDMVPLRSDILDILFIAHSQNIAQPTIVAVFEIKADNLEESMSIIEEIFRRERIVINFIEKTEIENGLYLEVVYEYEDGQRMKSKEKLLVIDNRFYLFSVMTLAEKFENQSLQMEHVINSIQIIK